MQTKGVLCRYTYRRGLSRRCSFILLWAMRRPRSKGRVTGTDSRAFSLYGLKQLYYELPTGESTDIMEDKWHDIASLDMNPFIVNPYG